MIPKITIIILNYNGYRDTCELLNCFFQIEEKNFNIILIDNCSTDSSIIEIDTYIAKNSTLQERITFIKNSENGGFAKGNNLGINFALKNHDFDYLWILNNDTIVEKNTFEILNNFFSKNINNFQNIGIYGNTLLYFYNKNKIQYSGGGYYKLWKTFPIARGANMTYSSNYDIELTPDYDFVYGASMFITKKFIENVGLMSEDYFIYFEELDWAIRAKKMGFKLGFIPKLKVYHKEGATISNNSTGKKVEPSKISTYYFFRNKLLFAKKYFKNTLIIIYLQFFIVVLKKIFKMDTEYLKMIIYILRNPNKSYEEYTEKK